MYGWKIEYDGVDISDKVSGFSISASLENFCREMTLDIADPDFYSEFDFTQVPASPLIEIFTKVADEWISQGEFFIERPARTTTVQSDLLEGIWGRSITALLADPFAAKISKAWDYNTTFFAICEEMCLAAGLTWDADYSDIADFMVWANTYEVENAYPIDVLTELAAFAGALISTDRAGHVCIRAIDYAPVVADLTLTDNDISEISETPEWPVFGNRVRITPTGSVAGYRVSLKIENNCLQADGTTRTKLMAQVVDSDGEPVDGLVMNWTSDAIDAALDAATSNTQETLIQREEKRATNYYTIQLDYPPSSVLGVWAYADAGRTNKLSVLGGYSIADNTITLYDKLKYCDQLLVIAYLTNGIAVNYLTAGTEAEDVTVMADVEGETADDIIYIDNPCQCPPSISLKADPSSMHIGEASALLVYVEESGPVTTGKPVTLRDTSETVIGDLSWTAARLGTVTITNEPCKAINDISGLSQCELSMYPASVSAVYRVDVNGAPTGANLYAAHDGKVINLTTVIDIGVDLLVNYVAQGAALAHFTATALGTATFRASIQTTREAPTDAEASISIIDETINTGGEVGGEDGEFPNSYSINQGDEPGECMPDEHPYETRFADGLEDGCDCEEMCQNEFDKYGTTQGYDGGSYRKVSDLVQFEDGLDPGTGPYWEKYNDRKNDAMQDCLDDCQGCENVPPLKWPSTNPETITQNSQVSVAVSGGKPPYHWTISGTGFTLQDSVTLVPVNIVLAGPTACGTGTVTVTDGCSFNTTGRVRSTSGQWVMKNECGFNAGSGNCATVTEIINGIKHMARWCYAMPFRGCDQVENSCQLYMGKGDGCSTPLTPPAYPPNGPQFTLFCCLYYTARWEWECL